MRADSHGRIKILTAINVIGLICALIGGIGETNTVSWFFPQIWGFKTPFGIGIGVITVIILAATASVKSMTGVDSEDRRYRFYASLTVSSTIMFAVFAGGMLLLYVFFMTAAS
ncbi:hypothetical protein ACTJKK_13155 [Microbacterium sp. 22179]|uniref:hypothetical protein n=1 Tax=Microbacterium sp. 22179 TaxID=3453886 RepID=UPI003F843715